MILVTEAYTPDCERRRGEIATCATRNAELGVFQQVRLDASPNRLSYGVVFRECANRWPGKLCVLANADIYFDESALLLSSVVRTGRLVTLSRWDSPAAPIMCGHVQHYTFFSGSQDAWAFVGGELVGIGDDVPLGYVGCDQVIVGQALAAGVQVVNPALSIRAWHLHDEQARPERPCIGGMYGYPELTTLEVTGRCVQHQWPQAEAT